MTKLIPFNKNNIKTTKAVLSHGGVIAFPTETVYGIGCDYKNEEAIKKIYKIKGRDHSKPLQILIANLEQLDPLIKAPKNCELIKHWPGPLTLVFWKKEEPRQEQGTKVGIRMPAHTLLYTLLKEVGPIAATSANLSGQPDALTAREVAKNLTGIDLILDGGKAEIGKPSTVVDVTTKPYKILRQGTLKVNAECRIKNA